MQIASTFTMQRANHDNVAVQEMLLVGSLLVQSSTCYYISPIKNWLFSQQDVYMATVATIQIMYLCALYICYVKCAVYMRHCPHAYLKAINGGANHITDYLHLTFEG